MTERRDIDCPPYAPVLMESTRAIGYSIESAIAETTQKGDEISARKWYNIYNRHLCHYIRRQI